MCLVLPSAYKNKTISYSTLEQLGFIDHPDGTHYAEQLLGENYAGYRGISSLKRQGYINQLSQILMPVAKGIGFTVLPEAAVHSFPEPDKVWVAPLQKVVSEELFLIRKKHRPLPARYNRLVQLIKRFVNAG